MIKDSLGYCELAQIFIANYKTNKKQKPWFYCEIF